MKVKSRIVDMYWTFQPSRCEAVRMTAHDAHLVARLHVDFGHVSSAVCPAG
jgi:hypothetical protein